MAIFEPEITTPGDDTEPGGPALLTDGQGSENITNIK